MSLQNVELVESYINAFNRRDLDTLGALNDPDMELDWSQSRGVDAGVYRGAEAVMGFYTEWFARARSSFNSWGEGSPRSVARLARRLSPRARGHAWPGG